MSKDFDKNRLKRLRIIDELLSTHEEGISRTQLVKLIEEKSGIKTDRFAVGRDLKFLSEQLGMAIDEVKDTFSDEKNHQVRFIKLLKYKRPGTSLFKINLDDDQRSFLSEALGMLGLKGIEQYKFFRQLKLNSDSKNTIISFTKNPKEESIGRYFQKLHDQIKQRNVISIGLRDRKYPGKIVTHRVHPWFLREYNRRWYLFGFDEKENGIKHYALDRIEKNRIKTLGGDYMAPYMNIDDILCDVIGVSIPDSEPLEIVFWVSDESSDFVSRKPIHHTQTEISESDIPELKASQGNLVGGKYYKIVCKNNYELRREMLSFGAELIVLSPNDLRSQLYDQLLKMVENYND